MKNLMQPADDAKNAPLANKHKNDRRRVAHCNDAQLWLVVVVVCRARRRIIELANRASAGLNALAAAAAVAAAAAAVDFLQLGSNGRR